MLPIGTELGRYRILNLIKRGGMGEVYRAEDLRLPRQVAIKVVQSEPTLYPNATASQEAMRLFQREMEAIARLDHPHILPLIDFGEQATHDAQMTYMVMPLRMEGSLSDWLRRRTTPEPLSPEDIAYLIRQAASALSYAHSQGFVHQDVKPSNFLVREISEQPDHPDLLLADFGVAKMTGTSKSSTNVRGTLEYMAPEQLNGHATAASDQYALAVMAYQLLTGRVPFTGTPTQIIYQHTQVQPPPPSSVNPRVPKQLDGVILRALAKDPGQRFPSAIAFSQALDSALRRDRIYSSGGLPPDSTTLPSGGLQEQETQRSGGMGGYEDSHYKETELASDHRNLQQRGSTPPPPVYDYIPYPPLPPPPPPRPFPIGKVLLIGLVVLIVLAGGIGLASGLFKPGDNGTQNTSVNSTATAQAISATATARAQQAAAATATAQVTTPVLNDSLSSSSSSNNWDQNSNCYYATQGYYVAYEATANTQVHCYARNTDFSNFTYQIQMRIIPNTAGNLGLAGGLVFRGDGGVSYYCFKITSDGYYYFQIYKNGNPTTLSSGPNMYINRGNQINLLAVTARGSAITLFVNGQQITQTNDSTYSHGMIGVFAAASTQITYVGYANAKVWSYSSTT